MAWDRVFSNCLQKMALTPDNEVPLAKNIQAYVNTALAWDNIDRLEETLSGAGISHQVNGIAIQRTTLVIAAVHAREHSSR